MAANGNLGRGFACPGEDVPVALLQVGAFATERDGPPGTLHERRSGAASLFSEGHPVGALPGEPGAAEIRAGPIS